MNVIQRQLKKTFHAFYCHSFLIMDQTFIRLFIPYGQYNTVCKCYKSDSVRYYYNTINLSQYYEHLSLQLQP